MNFKSLKKNDLTVAGIISPYSNELKTWLKYNWKETFPFISKSNDLYFGSDGHTGLGGLDVYVTRLHTWIYCWKC